jgi:hypothetical protein
MNELVPWIGQVGAIGAVCDVLEVSPIAFERIAVETKAVLT